MGGDSGGGGAGVVRRERALSNVEMMSRINMGRVCGDVEGSLRDN